MNTKKGFFMVFTALLFLLGASVAYGDTIEQEIAKCASITSEAERLVCYDCLAEALGLKGPEVALDSSLGKWEIDKSLSPIDDSPIVVLRLPSDESTANPFKTSFLIIRCRGNKTEVYIAWGEYIGSRGKFQVITRFDKEKAEKRTWDISSEGKATFYSGKHINLIRKMMKHEKLFAQVQRFNGTTTEAMFDLTGLSEAIQPICEACHWQ